MNFKKLTIVFLTLSVFLFAFSKQSMAQEKRITIQKKNISLKDAFNEIERQTNYNIAYKKSETDEKQKINLSLKDVSLEEALKEILKDTRLTYKINGYHIILVPKKEKTGSKGNWPYPNHTRNGLRCRNRTTCGVRQYFIDRKSYNRNHFR